MHCIICNAVLTDDEATLKDVDTGAYLDTCSDCLDSLSPTYELDDTLDDVYDDDASDYVVNSQHFDEDGNKVLDSDNF